MLHGLEPQQGGQEAPTDESDELFAFERASLWQRVVVGCWGFEMGVCELTIISPLIKTPNSRIPLQYGPQ